MTQDALPPGDTPANSARQPADMPNREWQLIEKMLLSAQEEHRRTRRWGIFFKALAFVYLFFVLWLLVPAEKETVASTSDHVAVVDVTGVIQADGDADAEAINGSLRDAFKADHAKAVILRINSPGGSPVQAGIVYDEIRRLRAEHPKKKVYAVIGDIGASGAYYIAAAADQIYCDKASIVGSIGVIMNNFGAEELIHKIGVENRTMTAGENKDILDPFAPINEEHRKHVQNLLDTVHQQFIAAVKEGRGDRLKDQPGMFSGLFWTGEQAVQLGLADGLGTTDYVAREVVGIDELVDYSYHRSALEQLADRFGASVGASLAAHLGVSANQPSMR